MSDDNDDKRRGDAQDDHGSTRDEHRGDDDRERDGSSDRDNDKKNGKSGDDEDADADGDKEGSDDSGSDNGSDDDDNDEKRNKTPLYKKPLFWIILVIVVAVLLIGGTLWYLNKRQFQSTDDAFVDAHIVRLAPQVQGTLVQVADVDNRHVQAGTLLAVIQPDTQQASVQESLADLKQAQAQVAQAQAQVASAIASRNQAADQARAPLADADKAAQDLARYNALVHLDRSAVASQQLDQARANARSTAAQAAAARRAVASADAQVAVARRQVNAAQAVVQARVANVQQARVTLGNYCLVAPISGQVVNRSVNLGSYVGAGTQLMAIVPDTMWVTANFKETQLARMRVGQPVTMSVDAYPGVSFLGHVDSIQRGAGQAFALLPAQNATGNYVKVVQRVPVRITFDVKNGPDPRRYAIGPGMSVVPTVKVR